MAQVALFHIICAADWQMDGGTPPPPRIWVLCLYLLQKYGEHKCELWNQPQLLRDRRSVSAESSNVTYAIALLPDRALIA